MAINLSMSGTTTTTETTTEYIKEVDSISSSDLMYIGEATPGTATSSASWRIKRIDLNAGTDSDISIRYAEGTSNFDNIWDNHLTLNYS